MNAVKPNVFVETYGCQMNVLDSELVRGQLESLGYQFVNTVEQAGVVLLNTCSVRELSEQKVWSQLGRLGIQKKANEGNLVIGVLGCMAEREGAEIIQRMPHVDVVCGPSNLDQLPSMIDNALQNKGSHQLSLAGHTSRRSSTLQAATDGVEALDLSRAFSAEVSQFQAYVRITRGCNKFCSFCVVPYTRGPEAHRSPESILQEIRKLLAQGVVEVTLLGQTVNHYEYHDGGKTTSFADLLFLIHEQIPELQRLRFLTSYPRDFTNDALDVMAQSPRICKYLHIPAQSGSNTMLKAMNRGYTVEQYLDLVERAYAKMPDIRLAGDMIVGFPNETDADHQASIELLKKVRYKTCYIFKYSPREGTVSQRRFEDNVPDAIKKARNLELLAVQADISKQKFEHMIQEAQPLSVLVEHEARIQAKPEELHDNVRILWKKTPADWVRWVGRTAGDELIAFDGPPNLQGKIVRAVPKRATPLTLMSEYYPENS